MIKLGRITSVAGGALTVDSQVDHQDILLDGNPLDPPAGVVLMMNKPIGYTCSTSDPGRIVYELLPSRFARRKPILSPVGRLDRETSGLLLLTDDGDLLHRIISPRGAIAKTYKVDLALPLRGDEVDLFSSGTLMLRSESKPLLPAVLSQNDDMSVLVTVTEGRYHQIRRMFSAVGNHVVALHRVQIGELVLGNISPGEWRYVSRQEIIQLMAGDEQCGVTARLLRQTTLSQTQQE